MKKLMLAIKAHWSAWKLGWKNRKAIRQWIRRGGGRRKKDRGMADRNIEKCIGKSINYLLSN